MEETQYGTPTPVTIDNVEYLVQPEDHKDQVFYHVTKDGEPLCVLGLNEEGQWEPNCEVDEDLVQKLGEAIEHSEI